MDINISLKKGRDLVNSGEYEKALTLYKRISNEHPDNHAAWYNQGFLLEQTKRFEEARYCYECAIIAGEWD